MKRSIPMCAALGLLLAAPAHADKMPSFAVSGGGGKSQNAEYQHFSAIVGMAVGTGSANGETAHHGFLARARLFAPRGQQPLVAKGYRLAAKLDGRKRRRHHTAPQRGWVHRFR